MQIKRLFFSTSFRVVILYIVFYLVTVIGFLWLMFSIMGSEIENNVRADIEREHTQIVEKFLSDPSTGLDPNLQKYIENANPVKSIYILKNKGEQTILTNYPYDTVLESGWLHLTEIEGSDLPVIAATVADDEGLLKVFEFLIKNPHDEGYVGLVSAVGEQTLFVGHTLDRINETKSIFVRNALIVLPLSIFLAVLGGILLSRLVMRRIDIINDQCREIRRCGDLSLRIFNDKPNDEYGLLISNINAMLVNIDEAVKNVQEVSDDVAHDLRTPLTRLKYGLEAGLLGEKKGAKALRDVIKTGLLETDDLLNTFSAILRITQINTGLRKSNFQSFNLTALAANVCEAYEPFAEKNIHSLSLIYDDERCEIFADKDMLTQIISNLIENALHHAGSALDIIVGVKHSKADVVLSVQDNGFGISPSERINIFKKFYRIDKSRTEIGNGLGLAMVKAVADLHNAELHVEDCAPGVKFSVIFPRTEK